MLRTILALFIIISSATFGFAQSMSCKHGGYTSLGSSYSNYIYASVHAERIEAHRVDSYGCKFPHWKGVGVNIRTWFVVPDQIQKTAKYTLATNDDAFRGKRPKPPNGIVGEPSDIGDGWKMLSYNGTTFGRPSFHYMIYKPTGIPDSRTMLLVTTQRYLPGSNLTDEQKKKLVGTLVSLGNKSLDFSLKQWAQMPQKAIDRAFRLKNNRDKRKERPKIQVER